ncbi:MAG: Mrp/NBP35 family ATP-binding protein [Acidimicrobiia bacterium]|nr:Mrp/NBP35 family ATP-binding protein [bacterium]MXX64061.1 Mrp/NBP35 family ATP-binding protein [Acidimicrobiia bacterium]MCY3651857.1 Mrp/NBP35 family ATP-binding protein [bacterium]MXZ06873.1 Mrp/NBP35 family ATP-binding protein [Acidimicrobiia bacterium]MYD04823.1 Mrp/NBP35 family ATP-binding protein [Acidimicrobiia bacterium]
MPATVTEDLVFEALRGVFDPELGADVVDLGMVREVKIEAGVVVIGLALTIAECPMRGQIENDTTRKIEALPGVEKVVVETRAMTRKQRSELMEKARRRARENASPTQVAPTTRVIVVGSGKGGVGKSSVSVNLAIALRGLGHQVGLLDADIWGFSVPRMLGVTEARIEADPDTRLMQPVEAYGIRVISTGLIIESEETALMWRGLMLSKALEQFLQQVEWGELGYLVIDLPPGTGDIQMALARLLPQSEMVVVTTPPRTAQKVAIRVADMARRSAMPVVGVIENMSYFETPEGQRFEVFGKGGGQDLADSLNIPLIGAIPLDPTLGSGADQGRPVVAVRPDLPVSRSFEEIARRLVELVPPADAETCTGRIAKLMAAL